MSGWSAAARPRRSMPARSAWRRRARPTSSRATAIARGDLRAISQDQIDRDEAKMRAIVAQPLAGAHAEISFDEDIYPPMPPTEGNRALLAQLNGVNRDMGLAEMGELDPVKRGAGDISFVAADVDGLVGLGPGKRRLAHRERDGRRPVDLQAGEARRDPDEPARRSRAARSASADLKPLLAVVRHASASAAFEW